MAYRTMRWRFRADDGSETAATWLAAEMTDIVADCSSGNYVFRLRVSIAQDTATAGNLPFRFRVSRNGGAFNAINTLSSLYVRANVLSPHVVHGANTTQQLTNAAGYSYITVNYGIVENSNRTSSNVPYAGLDVADYEMVMQVLAAEVNDGDTLDFRFYNNTTAIAEDYAVADRPRIVVSKATVYTRSDTGSLTSGGTVASTVGRVTAQGGTVSSSGTVTRRTAHSETGTLSTSGTLAAIKQLLQSIGGTLNSSGVVSAVKLLTQAVSGGLNTVGTVTRRLSRALGGGLSPTRLNLLRRTGKQTDGGLSSSGTVDKIKTRLQAVSGALSSAGDLLRRAGKVNGGSLTSDGTVSRRTGKQTDGTVSSGGTVSGLRAVLVALGGLLSSGGALATLYESGSTAFSQAVSGTLSSAGTVIRRTATRYGGTLASSGTVARLTAHASAGLLSASSSVARAVAFTLGGALGLSAVVVRGLAQTVDGALSFVGTLSKRLLGFNPQGSATVTLSAPSVTVERDAATVSVTSAAQGATVERSTATVTVSTTANGNVEVQIDSL